MAVARGISNLPHINPKALERSPKPLLKDMALGICLVFDYVDPWRCLPVPAGGKTPAHGPGPAWRAEATGLTITGEAS